MNSVEDEIGLRNLMARYVDAVNRRDAAAWIATWADAAEWHLLGSPVCGRDNILALWQQLMSGFEFALLLPSSCLFDVTGDTASGHWYLHEYSRDLDGAGTAMLSRYDDHYVKVDGQWLFRSRSYQVIYQGASDLGGTYTPPG